MYPKKIWVWQNPIQADDLKVSLTPMSDPMLKHQQQYNLIRSEEFMHDIKTAIMVGPLCDLEYRLNVTFLKHLGDRIEK